MWRYLASRKFGVIFAETVLLVGCVQFAYYLRFGSSLFELAHLNSTLWQAIVIALVFQASLHLNGAYNYKQKHPSKESVLRLFQGLLIATAALFILYYLAPALMIGRVVFFISLILSSGFLVIWHILMHLYLGSRTPHTNMLILGTSRLAREVAREVLRHPELGIKILGFVDENPQLVGVSIVNPKVIGLYQDLEKLVTDNSIDRIVVGLQDRRGKLPIKELLDFKTKGIAIEDATTFYERIAGKIPIENLKPSWMVFNSGFGVSKRLLLEKRILSIVISSALLILFSPIILILAILIKLDSRGPIFFRQERVGQNGAIFTLWKFRSMYENAERDTGPVWALKGDKRVTRMGKIMRRTRLDELPQFFNILKGDMSLVGPRPERPFFIQQLAETIPYYQLRHVVKPGLTGWAQINYRYASSLEHTVEKLQYDLFYIKNMSWFLDALIILETIKTVLVRKGS